MNFNSFGYLYHFVEDVSNYAPISILGLLFLLLILMPIPSKSTKKSKKKKEINFRNFLSPDSLIKNIKIFYSSHTFKKIVLTFIFVWILIGVFQIILQRYSFFKAERSLDSITVQLSKDFVVVNSEKERSCGKRSDVLAGEYLGGCSISYALSVSSEEYSSEQVARDIDKTIQGRKDVEIRPTPVPTESLTFYRTSQYGKDPVTYRSNYGFSGIKDLICSVSYTLKESDAKNIYVYVGCYASGDAKYPYFPFND